MKIAILGTRGIPNNYGGFEQCAESLSVGLVKKGYDVTVYNPSFHPFKETDYNGVKIQSIYSPQNYLGAAASNFVFDFLCLRHAVSNKFDIILELGLITAAPAIIFCNKRSSLIVTNLDGLEWKRAKWNPLIRTITKKLEKFGVKKSNYIVSDNIAIQEYVKLRYNKESEFIAYGAEQVSSLKLGTITKYLLEDSPFILTIARLEPENNIELMCDSYLSSNNSFPYYIIGNHNTKYGEILKSKYKDTRICFLGAIFNKEELDTFRYFAKYYLHGHSVGGTNPALIEAMAASAFILIHNNPFNKSVVCEDNFSFSDSNELKDLLENKEILSERDKLAKLNLAIIDENYRWEKIVDQYESYFLKILNHK